jgi:hypothetical protein
LEIFGLLKEPGHHLLALCLALLAADEAVAVKLDGCVRNRSRPMDVCELDVR